jgi:hypothetical protein
MGTSEPPMHPLTPPITPSPPAVESEFAPIEALHDPAAALTALAALYQGEKTDASYIFNTAMALMAIAVAYLVFAIPSVGNLSGGQHAGVFLILLPVPLWLVAAFHSLITLNAMSHGVSVQIIEQQLFDASELQVRRDLVGSAAGDRIMDINKSKLIHRCTTVFVYAGVAILIVGFTCYAVYSASEVKPAALAVPAHAVWAAAFSYGLLLLMVGLSWLVGLKMINKGHRESSDRYIKRFGATAKTLLAAGMLPRAQPWMLRNSDSGGNEKDRRDAGA